MDTERFAPFVLYTERISKNIKRIADEKLEPYGLRSSHLMCILQLAKTEGGLSSSSLADACGVDKAFVSRITGELSQKGYIIKDEKNATGKYKTKFILTEKGVSVYSIIEKILADCLEQVRSNISMKQLMVFYQVLFEMDDKIEKLTK